MRGKPRRRRAPCCVQRALEQAGLYVAGSVRDGVKRIGLADTAFTSSPYFSIDEVRYLYPEDEIKSYDEAMRTILRHIELDQEREIIFWSPIVL